jgi:hypothetical protein
MQGYENHIILSFQINKNKYCLSLKQRKCSQSAEDLVRPNF